jgi:hypothetical protein
MKNANVIQMLQLKLLLPGGPQLGSNGVFLVGWKALGNEKN